MFVTDVAVLFLALYRVFKNMEPLYFDSLAETDVVRTFLRSAKVFLSTSAENRNQDLPFPHGNHTL